MTILGIINTEKTRKNIFTDRLFCIIYQNSKDIWDKLLVHIFCMIFPLRENKEHDCSLFNTLSFDKVLMSNLFTFSRYQTKCVIEFLFETVEDIINFKACVRYFYQIFTFSPNDSPSKTEKYLSFHQKSSFRSQDNQIFLFFVLPSFHLPVIHCFRDWSKINLKVYDIINGLTKNLITHIVWYLEKEKRCDIQTLSIDRVLNKEHFYVKIMHQKCTKS